MTLALVVVPFAFALVAFAAPRSPLRPWLIPLGGAAHLALTVAALRAPEAPVAGQWLGLDELGLLFLCFVSLFYFLCSIYAVGYLALRPERDGRVFGGCMLAFLATMTLVIEAHHLGLMWVGVEACTLAAAPMLYFHRTRRSLEAVWKYLMVGSVGVAIALLGTFFIAYAALHGGVAPSLYFEDLLAAAPRLSRAWLRPAFVLLFIGYGTKLGLAPMHAWKPDAYGEAPGVVGALLSGGVTTCAFLAILRFYRVLLAASDAAFAREMMVVAGLLSMLVAGVFMARQRDLKRLLAYSSVEHMGILALGVGIGGDGVFGALYHVLNNGVTKGVLFLAAGNLQLAFGSKRTDAVRGALRRLPLSAALFFAGFFAITGTPPFAPFQSEFTILRAAFYGRRYALAGAFLALLAVVFVGFGATVLSMMLGVPEADGADDARPPPRDTLLTTAPIAAFLALSLALGVYLPAPVEALLRGAAATLRAP